ncbi:MAG: AMP-binding protein [Chlamydiales bacterium]|nr:AMP-binding protein [Chlamydiales bacterium]
MAKERIVGLLCWIIRGCIALRYRVQVVGLKEVEKRLKGGGGVLFLPNHPAEIDPIILMLLLWRPFRPHPLVVEHFFYLKGFHAFMRLVGALPLPTMDAQVNSWKTKQISKLLKTIDERRRAGENFLIYPGGKLKLTGSEVLGGASFVHNLLKDAPETEVVLVRTTGLWGSSFSRALTGKVPGFGEKLVEGIKILLKNGIFFTPRRTVKVEFEFAAENLPVKASRLDFNRYLENWYNRYPDQGPEPVSLVSYSFWKEELPTITTVEKKKRVQGEAQIPAKLEREIFAEVAKIARRPVEEINRSMHLSYDLGLDSLDVTQLYLLLDERYGIVDLIPGDIQTVEDLIAEAAGRREERGESEQLDRIAWPQELVRAVPIAPLGDTIAEAFLLMSDRMGKSVACADALSGVLTYQKVKRAALVLSLKIREMPGENIGILLPSSAAVYILILATHLAGKTPVMLNWTAGQRSLDHSAEMAELKTVISSMRFLGRKEIGELGKIDEKIQLLEDIRLSITWKDKMRGVLLAHKRASKLLKALKLDHRSKEERAVILFTSGTESLPKGVPLSHGNLLSNQRAAFSRVDLNAQDLLYGVLPPFHSFGFSVTGLLPLLTGLKVVYAPDPTDSHGMASDIAHWQPTMFCCAPSFIKALFRAGKPEELSSIRLFVTGAEKASQDLFDFVESLGPGHEMIEGYGITECSPIVTMSDLYMPRKGVGRAIPEEELCVIDATTLEPLASGLEGEVCVCGPNVFKGYLDKRPSPFISIQGREWYRTGDRGYVDGEGNLYLSGRLKRFVKIGGEMVSLGGLEEELLRLARDKSWGTKKGEGPSLAIAVRERESEKPTIVLFATFTIDKETVNGALKEGGFGKLVKIAEVRQLEEIPLTGTGKTHYRLLDEMLS